MGCVAQTATEKLVISQPARERAAKEETMLLLEAKTSVSSMLAMRTPEGSLLV